jgi:predicted metalloendopeptidase
MPLPTPLDPSHRDPDTDPGADFFRFANGGWLDANPVPPAYGSWGSFHEVTVGNEALLHDLLRDAAETRRGDGSPGDVAGRFFASGMDTAAIEAAAGEPLATWFDRIDDADSVAALRALAVDLHPLGARIFFGLYVSPDFDDSDSYLLYLVQGGLGLPERDYYVRDDERSVELRRLYAAHVAAQLVNAGAEPEDAAADAEAIVGFETALAEHSYTAAQLRDVDLTTNKHTRAELAEVMARFDLGAYLDAIGAAEADTVNLNNPGFFAALDRLLDETPLPVLRSYVRWHLVRATASALSRTSRTSPSVSTARRWAASRSKRSAGDECSPPPRSRSESRCRGSTSTPRFRPRPRRGAKRWSPTSCWRWATRSGR